MTSGLATRSFLLTWCCVLVIGCGLREEVRDRAGRPTGPQVEVSFRPVQGLTPLPCDPESPLAESFDGDWVPGDDACYVVGPEQADEASIESGAVGLGSSGSWEVWPVFTEAGIADFNRLAAECLATEPGCETGLVAIVVDDVVVSAPSILAADFERDEIVISGDFDEAEARRLVDALNGR